MPYLANIIPTVSSLQLDNKGLWYHSLDGIIPYSANIIAAV